MLPKDQALYEEQAAGFNFMAAWLTSWLAGLRLGRRGMNDAGYGIQILKHHETVSWELLMLCSRRVKGISDSGLLYSRPLYPWLLDGLE